MQPSFILGAEENVGMKKELAVSATETNNAKYL